MADEAALIRSLEALPGARRAVGIEGITYGGDDAPGTVPDATLCLDAGRGVFCDFGGQVRAVLGAVIAVLVSHAERIEISEL